MTLRLVYRAYGGENLKNRPSFFSKRVALASFVRAAEEADAEITFLNDGPMPPELTELMAGRGEQVPIPGGPIGLRGSYVKGLLLPSERGWAEDDIVYFCEDDYLHTQDSLTSLIRAAAELKHATYFTLHGNLPRTRADFPPGWVPRPSEHVGKTSWMNIPSTTSTFGARVGTIAEDMPIFRQCMRPFRRSFLDHETCLLYQGYQPYDLNGLLAGPIERRGHGIGAAAKNAFLIPFRLQNEASCSNEATPATPALLLGPQPRVPPRVRTLGARSRLGTGSRADREVGCRRGPSGRAGSLAARVTSVGRFGTALATASRNRGASAHSERSFLHVTVESRFRVLASRCTGVGHQKVGADQDAVAHAARVG